MLQKLAAAPFLEGGGGEATVVDGVLEPDGGVGVVGGVPGVVVAATTLMASFMPPPQWPTVGQMKYIEPALESGIVVLPSL